MLAARLQPCCTRLELLIFLIREWTRKLMSWGLPSWIPILTFDPFLDTSLYTIFIEECFFGNNEELINYLAVGMLGYLSESICHLNYHCTE